MCLTFVFQGSSSYKRLVPGGFSGSQEPLVLTLRTSLVCPTIDVLLNIWKVILITQSLGFSYLLLFYCNAISSLNNDPTQHTRYGCTFKIHLTHIYFSNVVFCFVFFCRGTNGNTHCKKSYVVLSLISLLPNV